ncbi:MAG: tyrosine-type recombinase/integrase [Solirubrobacterales bacterium]
MARRATGNIIEHQGADGRVYRALRFTAYKKRRYVSLGAITAVEAERELRHVLADVERGTWQPPQVVEPPPEPELTPTFHVYAEEWWTRNERRFAASTLLDYRWRLEQHLLPFFEDHRLDAITFDAVERYIAAKLAEADPLSARSINMTVTLLGAILEGAVERELIPRNPARGKGRRVRERAPRRTYLETAAQIAALLDAAGELDRAARVDRRHVERRAMLATLTFAGLRIGELCALCWRDVDLEAGWLRVGESKTDAGRRRVKLRPALAHELAGVCDRQQQASPDGFVFPTGTGGRQSRDNFRSRVLKVSVERANENLAKRGHAPLPEGLTPHSLRRTFASVLYALGEDPGIVMDEMGHTDPSLALRIYRQSMRRGEDEKDRLHALVEGVPKRQKLADGRSRPALRRRRTPSRRH